MTRFEYHAPQSLDEALALLSRYGGEACLLAGGTDLLLNIREGKTRPAHVINIKRIEELRGLEAEGGGLRLGALTTVAEVLDSPIVHADYPALAQAAASMAAVQIRNLATVGGNLCNASPAADLAPPLIALDARVEIAGNEGRRELALADFFQGPGETALKTGEIVVSVRLPSASERRCTFLKMTPRGAMDIAVASVAVALTGTDGHCEDVRIIMGAVGPVPLRAVEAEKALRGQSLNEENIGRAAHLAADEARPIDDLRASAWYRRAVIEALTRRALSAMTGEPA